MKFKKLLILSLFISIFTGCSNITFKYPVKEETQNKDDIFSDDIASTFTDNVTSQTLQELYQNCKKATVTIEIYIDTGSKLSLETREQSNILLQNGLYISEVTNPQNNLKANTITTHIDNKKVYTFSDFATSLYKKSPGDTIEITYCNPDGTNPTTIEVTLN